MKAIACGVLVVALFGGFASVVCDWSPKARADPLPGPGVGLMVVTCTATGGGQTVDRARREAESMLAWKKGRMELEHPGIIWSGVVHSRESYHETTRWWFVELSEDGTVMVTDDP